MLMIFMILKRLKINAHILINKTMELEFLTIGEYQHKEYYLQHISEMINIKLDKNDTYNILFDKMKSHFENDKEKLITIESWNNNNIKHQDDISVFDNIITEDDNTYAAFNLRK